MGLILDTSLLIADEREALDLQAWLRRRPPEPVAVSVITFSELWFGIELDSDRARRRRRQRWVTKVFGSLEIVPFDRRIARVHSKLWSQLAKTGRMIGSHDLIIAATALTRRWSLATLNVQEFRHVPGLKVISP